MITVYGYKKCGTSRKGEKALNDYKKDFKFIDITVNPPSKSLLKKMILQSGEPLKKFFNTSGGAYKEMNMKEKVNTLKESQLIDLLVQNGMLIKRPIVTDGENTTVGFDEEKFKKQWKK